MPDVDLFTRTASVDEALGVLLSIIQPVERSSMIDLENADNRVLSRDVFAPKDFPHYDMCHMDGYAVMAGDTAGCGASPVFLKPADGDVVRSGFCRQVHTGSALPDGADAVVRLEDAKAEDGGVWVYHEAASGENVTPRGKTVRKGDLLYKKGMQLKPTSIAMLATLGLAGIEVYEKPKVLVIPTGDELVGRGTEAGPGSINESNGLMCYLFVRRYGGKAQVLDVVPDNVEKLAASLKRGLKYDLVVTSGGSSVGKRDHMSHVISSMGAVLVHGVRLKPGRPMGIGYVEGDGARAPVVFLPGFPDACTAGLMTFVDRAIRKLGHYPESKYPKCQATLSEKARSFPGTRALRKVAVDGGEAKPAQMVGPFPDDGELAYAVVPEQSGGYEAGETVELIFLE